MQAKSARLMRPCARYVRRRCFCAWLTWMCEMNSVSTSRPFTCASIGSGLRVTRRDISQPALDRSTAHNGGGHHWHTRPTARQTLQDNLCPASWHIPALTAGLAPIFSRIAPQRQLRCENTSGFAASAVPRVRHVSERPPTSALLSAFFSRFSRNTADFFGHRAWPLVEFSFLAYKRRVTTHVKARSSP